MKKVNLRSKVFALCVLLFVCLLPMSAFAASDPLKSTKITVSKVRSILKQYCPDGYYIIRNDGDADANLTRWWSQGDTLEEGIDAAVHEQTHAYSFYKMDYNWKTGLWSENIYTGNGKKVSLKQKCRGTPNVLGSRKEDHQRWPEKSYKWLEH